MQRVANQKEQLETTAASVNVPAAAAAHVVAGVFLICFFSSSMSEEFLSSSLTARTNPRLHLAHISMNSTFSLLPMMFLELPRTIIMDHSWQLRILQKIKFCFRRREVIFSYIG